MTGYTSGAKILADIIDDIANEIIASHANWTDAELEVGAGKWTTTDKTENNAMRALKYTNGSEVQYITLEAINKTSGQNFVHNGSYWFYAKGIRIRTSKTWDMGTDEPSTGFYSTFIPFETRSNAGVTADLATLQITYYKWVDATGFVIMLKPEPVAADDIQQSFIICMERAATKEYSDGEPNFGIIAIGNIWAQYYEGTSIGSEWKNRSVLRLAKYQYPDHGSDSATGPQGQGLSFIPTSSYYAFKSVGNSKVYYVKPILHNHNGSQNPIFQFNLFFPWSESVGLIDGDVIAIEGDTKKYLCKSLDSPDSTNRLNYAIRYN